MSKPSNTTLYCPKCKKENRFTIWESLNGDLNPQAKEALLTGDLFKFTCESCGYSANVDFPMLYHDMVNQAMIYYVPETSVEDVAQLYSDTGSQPQMMLQGYRKRIVTDQNHLREKAIIFDAKLDDRVIELLKLIYLVHAQEHFPDKKLNNVYFYIADGEFKLDFLGADTLHADLPREAYENTKAQFADQIEACGDQEYIIDREWALRQIK